MIMPVVAVKDLQERVAKSAHKPDKQGMCLEEKGSLICTKQSQTIESLLPDEEDLFSGVLDDLEPTPTVNTDDEDFDLFSSSGGMELEENTKLYFGQHKFLTAEGLDVNFPERAESLMQQITQGRQDQLRSCQNPYSNSLPHVVTGYVKDEYIYGLHSPLQTNCSFTNSFPSTVGVPSTCNTNQFGHMIHYSTDQAFHPQSLPINCKGVVTYDYLNMESVGFTPETNDKHLHMFGSYGSPTEHMFGASSRIARSALSGHHVPNCSNSLQNHHHLNPLIWSYSPPFNNDGVFTHTTSITKKCSLGRPRGRARRTSQGRHESVSCHNEDKKFELDIERVLRGEDSRTTLMIKNIPNKYSSAMLLTAINEHNEGTYDFLYLPLDFKNKCNMGYAFINMTDPLQIVPFHKTINGKKWEKFHSGKVACLAYARIQGKAALIAHFQESSLLNEDKCCHPILFTTNGPNAGTQEPFPLGPNFQTRRHKNRCNTHKVNANQEMSTSRESYYHIKNTI